MLADEMIGAMKDTSDILDANNFQVAFVKGLKDDEIEMEAWKMLWTVRSVQAGVVNSRAFTAPVPTFHKRWKAVVACMRHSKAAVYNLFKESYLQRYASNPVAELESLISNNYTNRLRSNHLEVPKVAKKHGPVAYDEGTGNIVDAQGNIVKTLTKPTKRTLSDFLDDELDDISKPSRGPRKSVKRPKKTQNVSQTGENVASPEASVPGKSSARPLAGTGNQRAILPSHPADTQNSVTASLHQPRYHSSNSQYRQQAQYPESNGYYSTTDQPRQHSDINHSCCPHPLNEQPNLPDPRGQFDPNPGYGYHYTGQKQASTGQNEFTTGSDGNELSYQGIQDDNLSNASQLPAQLSFVTGTNHHEQVFRHYGGKTGSSSNVGTSTNAALQDGDGYE
ncbi:hypothetical protein B0T20DRAFT_477511 [Sordaria brevicollis]|uniref:Uncharacterized protein n=1 Tax=Sordaria brevicollis TaxID=83679 RepID=A0AAE0PH01_SORBR|nr:hypothetical protein B0T20DRAFT_477511 [Sordaria brevicollis]